MASVYLIEHYRAGAHIDELRRSAVQVQDAIAQMEGEGIQIRHLTTTIVGGDNYLASVLEASDEEVAREAFRRAGITFERVSPAISTPNSAATPQSLS